MEAQSGPTLSNFERVGHPESNTGVEGVPRANQGAKYLSRGSWLKGTRSNFEQYWLGEALWFLKVRSFSQLLERFQSGLEDFRMLASLVLQQIPAIGQGYLRLVPFAQYESIC